METEKQDLFLVILWPVFASFVSLLIGANYFLTIIIFLGLPAFFLSLRKKDVVRKAAIFAGIIGVSGTILVEYIAHATRSYVIETALPIKAFGLFPFESFLFGFFAVYFPVMFYEYFLEDHVNRKLWQPRMKYLVSVIIPLTVLASIIFHFLPNKLNLPYLYFLGGIIFFAAPVVIELLEYPKEWRKLVEAGTYFFFLTSLYEITALRLGIWSFYQEGMKFIGWVSFMGVNFPIEELIFWFILMSMAFISMWDIWDDYPNH